jgi:hypothetical protein
MPRINIFPPRIQILPLVSRESPRVDLDEASRSLEEQVIRLTQIVTGGRSSFALTREESARNEVEQQHQVL